MCHLKVSTLASEACSCREVATGISEAPCKLYDRHFAAQVRVLHGTAIWKRSLRQEWEHAIHQLQCPTAAKMRDSCFWLGYTLASDSFRRSEGLSSFCKVWMCCIAADWLQGPYVYANGCNWWAFLLASCQLCHSHRLRQEQSAWEHIMRTASLNHFESAYVCLCTFWTGFAHFAHALLRWGSLFGLWLLWVCHHGCSTDRPCTTMHYQHAQNRNTCTICS